MTTEDTTPATNEAAEPLRVNVDEIISSALKLIEEKSQGLVRLGAYEIWCADGRMYTMKPRRSFAEWIELVTGVKPNIAAVATPPKNTVATMPKHKLTCFLKYCKGCA